MARGDLLRALGVEEERRVTGHLGQRGAVGAGHGHAAAIERLLGDPAEAARLREAGRARAARFTWARTADLTLASYERALAAAPPP